MATTSTAIQELYADIVADLVPFYDNAVLLPNPQFILNTFNISGTSGNTVKVPLTNSYTDGATVGEGNSIVAAAASDFDPTSVNITMLKRGVGTDVTEESLEDGGLAVVRQAVLTRLSRGLAQATDKAGFATMKAGFGATDFGEAGTNSAFTTNFVFSPEAIAYATKREPNMTMFYDVDKDTHLMRATIRNGFITLRSAFGARVTANKTVGSATANLTAISQAVASLRSNNAPEMLNGMYIAMIDPSLEFSIASQLNSVTAGSVGDLSVIGNRALLTGLIGQAAGCEFYRTNNLPDAAA